MLIEHRSREHSLTLFIIILVAVALKLILLINLRRSLQSLQQVLLFFQEVILGRTHEVKCKLFVVLQINLTELFIVLTPAQLLLKLLIK
jgi:hypothetical protein